MAEFSLGINVGRDDYRTMTVGVHEIALIDAEPKNVNRCSDFPHMNKAVTGSYRSGDYRESGLQIAQVSHHAIREGAGHSQTFVHGRVNLAPPGGDAIRVILILDDGYRRAWSCRHRSKVFDATCPYYV